MDCSNQALPGTTTKRAPTSAYIPLAAACCLLRQAVDHTTASNYGLCLLGPKKTVLLLASGFWGVLEGRARGFFSFG